MQLTIDKYTQMVARLDVRDLDLANAFHTQRLDADVLRCLRSATGELSNDRGERLDVGGADDHIAEAPALSAA